MTATVRARVKHGMLELLDKVDLPEGAEVTVTILAMHEARGIEGLRCSAGAWQGLVDAETLINRISADRRLSTRPVPRL